jgi:hypothetical protein
MKPWNWLNYKDDDNREKFKNIIDNYRGELEKKS